MARSNPLTMLAKHVAADLASGGPGEGVAMAMAVLDRLPDAAEQLIDLIVAEGRRKRPDGGMIEAFAMMLGQALESLRFGVEGDDAGASARLDGLRGRLVTLVDTDAVDPDILLLVVRQFTIAGLDPGDGLRDRVAERLGAVGGPEDGGDGNPLEPLVDMAAQVEDEFTLFALIHEMSGALPDSHRAVLGAAAFAPGVTPTPGLERLREASLGWLFDPVASVRQATAAVLAGAAEQGQVTGTTLRRLVALRNWMPEGERAGIDRAIRAGRTKGIAMTPAPAADLREAYATGWDGAGAQSIFLVVKDGRRFAAVSLLLKQGYGLRDVWVQRGGTRRDVDDLLNQVDVQVGLVRTSLDYVIQAAACALGTNAASGVMPPFGLLDAVEMAGLANLQPVTVTPADLLDSLNGDTDGEVLDAQAERLALLASASWTVVHPFAQSWFESGQAVDALIGVGRKRLAKGKALDLILDGPLEEHRAVWAERFAWIAATLRPPKTDVKVKGRRIGSPDWTDFALVARALLTGRALRDIPVMVAVAEATIDFGVRAGAPVIPGCCPYGCLPAGGCPVANRSRSVSLMAE